ncbi:MAG: hypothetical protein L0G99_16885 [Propionibacteriales bacterium]|nr:hypothetical protein [Propionibacteriales bacterium]
MAMIRKGTALDGRVTVTLSGSRVEHVHLDPRALRASTDALAAAFATAVNEALAVDRTDVIDTIRAMADDVQDQRVEAERRLAQVREELICSTARASADLETAAEQHRHLVQQLMRHVEDQQPSPHCSIS